MMMTMTLHPWIIKIDLGRIKVERMLVLVGVELIARKRTSFIYVSIYKTRCVV
jgi:hypothetical protein